MYTTPELTESVAWRLGVMMMGSFRAGEIFAGSMSKVDENVYHFFLERADFILKKMEHERDVTHSKTLKAIKQSFESMPEAVFETLSTELNEAVEAIALAIQKNRKNALV